MFLPLPQQRVQSESASTLVASIRERRVPSLWHRSKQSPGSCSDQTPCSASARGWWVTKQAGAQCTSGTNGRKSRGARVEIIVDNKVVVPFAALGGGLAAHRGEQQRQHQPRALRPSRQVMRDFVLARAEIYESCCETARVCGIRPMPQNDVVVYACA